MSEPYTLGDLWACHCGRTAPYRCPACEVARLEAEIKRLEERIANELPDVNVAHLLDP